jgi:hypothetical protein
MIKFDPTKDQWQKWAYDFAAHEADNMIDQENEHRQMKIEKQIGQQLESLYNLLLASDRPNAEGTLGFVAQAKAEWEEGDGGAA